MLSDQWSASQIENIRCAVGTSTPILVVANTQEANDRIMALDAGADMSIQSTTPAAELIARLAALVRRSRYRSGTGDGTDAKTDAIQIGTCTSHKESGVSRQDESTNEQAKYCSCLIVASPFGLSSPPHEATCSAQHDENIVN